MIQHLRLNQFDDDFKKQAKALDKTFDSKTWNQKVIGRAMVVNVVTGFLRQEDPNGKKWKSSAAKTKFGGRFSADYKKRPSGLPVTPSSLRLNDSGDFMGSYDVLWASKKDVEVGPIGSRNRRIAEAAETTWKNPIVGWGKRGKIIVDKQIEVALDRIAKGKPLGVLGFTPTAGMR